MGEWNGGLGSFPISTANFLVLWFGSAGTFEGWRYAVRLSVLPAEEDWQMMRLPGPLAPLYIALRPLRYIDLESLTQRFLGCLLARSSRLSRLVYFPLRFSKNLLFR
jgi:hypothetical protein